jgi:hypothetical protein
MAETGEDDRLRWFVSDDVFLWLKGPVAQCQKVLFWKIVRIGKGGFLMCSD